MKEIKSLTGIRGVFALYVCFYHFFSSECNFINNGYLSVDIFLVLSAYIMSYTYKNLFSESLLDKNIILFMKHRIFRIYPLYLSILFFSISYQFLYTYIETGRKIIPETLISTHVFENLLLIQGFNVDYNIIPASWSLSDEMALYLIFPFLFYFIYNYENTKLLFFSFSVFALNIISSYGIRGPLDIYTGYHGLIRCLCDYSIGLVIYHMKIFGSKKYIDFLVILSILLLMAKGFDIAIIIIYCYIIKNINGSKSIFEAFLSSRPIMYLGQISFSLYLWHTVVSRTMSETFSNMFFHDFFRHEFYNFLLVSIVLSILTYHLIEIPSKNFLRKKFP